MAEPNCHYCNRPADEECPTCGRLYCLEHGEDVCLRCLAPEAATPSVRVYRGSLLALVAATLVAVFLLVRPPESKSDQDTVRPLPTPTPAISATATATPQGATVPPRTATVPATAAGATSSPGASPAGTAAAARTYTVQPGDTLSGIAAQFNTTVQSLLAANPGVTAETLQIGAVLTIPGAGQ